MKNAHKLSSKIAVMAIVLSAFALSSCGVSRTVQDEANINELEAELDRREAEMKKEEAKD